MAANYRASLKTARMQLVADDIDSGTGAGTLEIGTAGMAAVLATFTLNDPCGTVSGAVLTGSGFPKTATATGAGTAAAARIRNSSGVDIVTGLTVGTSGTDVILGTTAITVGLQVTLNSLTDTHAA